MLAQSILDLKANSYTVSSSYYLLTRLENLKQDRHFVLRLQLVSMHRPIAAALWPSI